MTHVPASRIPLGFFFALFTVSGFAGLIYQSIWSHYLKLFLGHAAYAQTLVLAIFMGGMALGSWLASRYAGRLRDLLLGYAAAELGIGLLAIAFHAVFQAATAWAFDTVLPSLASPAAIDAFKWTLASALILPASILLGTTFPLMSAGLIRRYPGDAGRSLAMLYFTNSLGAAIGVLASGFFLIERIGLPGTILAAGILNIVLAGVVRVAVARRPAQAIDAAPAEAQLAPESPRVGAAILAVAMAMGAASFIYEVAWIRMLSLGLGSSTQSFEVMLAAFIFGMALGGYLVRDRAAAWSRSVGALAALVAAKGFTAIMALGVYMGVLDLTRWAMGAIARSDTGYSLFLAFGFGASLLVMLPTAVFAGMTLPIATSMLLHRGHGEAAIGHVYSANTFGCILGAFFATHAGMETLGVKGLTGFGAALDIGAAAGLLLAFGPKLRARAFAGAAALVALGVATYALTTLDTLKMASGVFRHGEFAVPGVSRVDYYRDGKTATVAVVTTGTIGSIHTNGKPDGSVQLGDRARPSPDEATMVLSGALPLAYAPAAREIAIIGMGSGLTTHTVLGSDRAVSVDTIEIERAMVEGARLFAGRNARAYNDPRSHLVIEDAKTYFAARGRKYDLVIAEPSNPWVSGVSTLFSEEFYRHIGRYLEDDGILVQWIGIYEINLDLVATVFKALGQSFGDYQVYSAGDSHMIVVATKGAKLHPPSADVFAMPGVAAELAALGYRSLHDFELSRIGSRAALEPLFLESGLPANSDFHPVLDLNAARSRFANDTSSDLETLKKSLVPIVEAAEAAEADRRPTAAELGTRGTLTPRWTQGAYKGRDALRVWSGEPVDPASLGAQLEWSLRSARAALADCRLMSATWVDVVEELYALTAPVLAASELRGLGEGIARSSCVRELPRREQGRLQLLDAIALRDYARMAALSEALLALPGAFTPKRALPVLLAGMTGYRGVGRPEKALALLQRHGSSTFVGNKDLVARLVLAHARPAPARP